VKTWKLASQEPINPELLKLSQNDSLVARLLVNRNIKTTDLARYFLELENISETCAFEIPDMQKAIDRINLAILRQEKIVIYGDYDVDGTSSTALLYRAFSMLGKQVDYYIPSRHHEGYGLNKNAILKLKEKFSANLLITCDCGISNFQEIEYANFIGLDVIVTDHHSIPEIKPPSVANCNPKVLPETHPLHYLPGVGVAYKLAQLLLEHNLNDKNLAKALSYSLLDLVALGMIADLAPLRAENRYLVVEGLKVLAKTEKTGLKKLLNISGVETNPNAEHIGFGLAPRINAAGRLADANRAVQLMITEDETQAAALADELNSDNQERQVLCAEIFESALQMIESEHLKDNVLALASPDWNHGVIGIVASRLLDRFYLPVFIMAIEGDIAKGSVRCIDVPGLDIYEEMKNIQLKHNIFLKYGGHKMAAGFSVSSSRVLEFQKIIREHFFQLLSKKDISKILKIDSAIRLQELSSNFLNRIAKLAPYGVDNPSALFVAGPLKIKSTRSLGKEQKHLKIFLQEPNNPKIYEALIWNRAQEFLDDFGRGDIDDLSIAFTPKEKFYLDELSIELEIKDWKHYQDVDPVLFSRFRDSSKNMLKS
jgi:single-stranded-DNA-specific exonuclease